MKKISIAFLLMLSQLCFGDSIVRSGVPELRGSNPILDGNHQRSIYYETSWDGVSDFYILTIGNNSHISTPFKMNCVIFLSDRKELMVHDIDAKDHRILVMREGFDDIKCYVAMDL